MLFRALLLMSVIVLGGCASFSAQVAQDAEYNAEEAYLYGLFDIDRTDDTSPMDAGLVVENVKTKKQYSLKFPNEAEVLVIQVPAGQYKIVEVAYYWENGRKDGYSLGAAESFELASGKAAYVGSFVVDAFSRTKKSRNWMYAQDQSVFRYNTRLLSDIYPKVTALFKAKYTWAKNVETLNTALR